jgi:hypothetical protein
VWDLSSIFTVAGQGGVSWVAFPDQFGYPTKFYKGLAVDPGSANVHPPKDFIPMAKAGTLPQVCYVWSPAGDDEHPPHVSDPTGVSKGRTWCGSGCGLSTRRPWVMGRPSLATCG